MTSVGWWIISFDQECYVKVLSSSWHFVMLFDSYVQPKFKISKEDVLCTVSIILCWKNEKNIHLHKLKYIKWLPTVTVLVVYQLLYTCNIISIDWDLKNFKTNQDWLRIFDMIIQYNRHKDRHEFFWPGHPHK